MDPVRFATLIGALELRARHHPRLYRIQVGLVAALGYVYVAALMLLLLGFIGGVGYLAIHARGGAAIVAKLALPALGLVYLLLRALWIRLPDAEGIPLPADRFPALAAMIEKVRDQLDAPRFRRVLLDGDFNAAVAQRPRFGLVGPSVNDLILGLPLMQALSPREFEAVLAHELGHVSRQHGRFGHWIYRIRTTWSRLAAAVEARGGSGLGGFLLGRFLSWYAPFFNAYSFVLARQDEYEADASAVRVTGRASVAAALVRIQVLGRFHVERHWGGISRALTRSGETPAPHAAFIRALNDLDAAEADTWLLEALRRPTDYGDTHPSLGDRLRAIGAGGTTTLPAPTAETAASRLLGPAADALAGELDERWQAAIRPRLAEALAERETARSRLEEIGAVAAEPEVAWERVQLLDRLDRDAEAQAGTEELLGAWPDHAPALYFLGRARLAADDARGIALLERAAALHPAARPAVQELVFDYHWRHGRREQAEAARKALVVASERLEAAGLERASMAERPVLVPHDLAPDHVERIRGALVGVTGLRAVYLARRIVVELPEMPCYLVGVVPARRWWKLRKTEESVRLRDQVMAAGEWPESTYFIVPDGGHRRLVRRIGKLAGARISGPESAASSAGFVADPAQLEQLRAGLARRRTRRRRLRLTLVAAGVSLALLVGWIYQHWRRDVAATPLRQFTAAQAAERVRGARGRVLVLVLYDPERDDGLMVGGLRRWATSLGRSQVELFALTVGDRHDAQAFFRYYAAEWGVPRLAPFWLEPWKPGALDSTMATLGVRVGATWSVPLVAVIDPDGRVIAQWQGETVAQPIIAAAEHALDRRSAPRTASASAPAPSASPPPGSAAPLSSPANR